MPNSPFTLRDEHRAFDAQAMNHSIFLAVSVVCGVSAGSAVAGPALLDYPGPGYRKQLEHVLQEKRQKEPSMELNFNGPTFQVPKTKGILPTDTETETVKPFTQPIRLFPGVKVGPDKVDLPKLEPKQ
jgi:hypothetical protein